MLYIVIDILYIKSLRSEKVVDIFVNHSVDKLVANRMVSNFHL